MHYQTQETFMILVEIWKCGILPARARSQLRRYYACLVFLRLESQCAKRGLIQEKKFEFLRL